jgi:hypothetical protein
MQAKDYRAAFDCYTPESQERALGMMLNQVALIKAHPVPQLQSFLSRMSSFGVPMDTLVPGGGPNAAAAVSDKAGCLGAFIEEFDNMAQSNPIIKSFPNPFEAIASAQLANVQINGETATGSVTLTLNGAPRTQGINFRKASGGWRLDEMGAAAAMASSSSASPGLPRSAAVGGVAPFDVASAGAPAAGPAMADPAMMPAVGTAGTPPATDPLNDPAMAATAPGAVPVTGPLGAPVAGTPGAAIPADPAMAAAIPAPGGLPGAPGAAGGPATAGAAIPPIAGAPGAAPAGAAIPAIAGAPGAAADPAMAGAAIPAGVGAIPGAPGALAAGDPAMAAAGIPGAEGAVGAAGGGGPPQFPEGSVEYVVQKVVLAIINEKPEGLEDVISERAKGVLLSLRDGSIEPEKLTELKGQFNQVTLLSAKNSGTTRTIVLRGGEGHVMTFTVGKEKDANVVKDLKVQEARRPR